MKILVATQKPFAAAAVAAVKKTASDNGHKVVLLEKYEGKAQLLEAVKDVDAMIVRSDRVDHELIDNAPNLKIVVRAGAGYDNLDLAACEERGIVAMNTPGQNANAVAELAVAMMFYLSRNQLNPGKGIELAGKRLGIHAYGNVGRRVALKGIGLGMTVSAFDAYVPDEVMEKDGVKPLHSANELYSQNDFVSVHVPKNSSTVCSVGAELLSQMPEGGCVINTARREIMNEEELMEILEERQDLKYGTDLAALKQEEFEKRFGLRVFATPKKMGAETAEANYNAAVAAVSQICDYFATGNTKFQLHLSHGED